MAKNTLSLYHIIRESSLKTNAPLLIMLHGYGSDETDLYAFASELPEALFIISVRAPFPMPPYGNAWYAINFEAEKGKWSDTKQAAASRDLIADFIDEAIATYPVDKDHVSLLGFSQGTVLGYAVALTYPHKVKNLVALSGYINTDLIPKDFKTLDYSKLDFYCSHGSLDQVIPVEWARQSKAFLAQLHIKFQYAEFPVGHGVAPQNFYELKAWLTQRIPHL
ncbi:alpha/beta hydrolase [Aestuariivivens sediminis]|uniref:alpha/beta hydrolase n=1 Tax=Aestuariivivens sediminis TaxID=2913557 RepID=UPI001F571F27|nr:alpha/beta fold hydrolase [Aestuariivivens sediminis]